MSKLKSIKRLSFQASKTAGLFYAFGNSRWRKNKLLILCYHGVSVEDEHEWRPALYIKPSDLKARLDILKQGKYNILPFSEAIERLYAGDLPARSITITFDDGEYGFYKQAHPILKSYQIPVTVYLRTDYCEFNRPIFNLICSYMLWKRRGTTINLGKITGNDQTFDLSNAGGRAGALETMTKCANERALSDSQKDDLARELAVSLNISYDELLAKRILHLLSQDEVTELSASGVDFQLHTHHHRTPHEHDPYLQEIKDNSMVIESLTGSRPIHFCYPSGMYRTAYLPWLKDEGIISATTCEPGLASRESNPLLLPRLIDHSQLSPIEFEAWLTGVASFFPSKHSYSGNRDGKPNL